LNHLNQPIGRTHFFKLLEDMTAYIERLPEIWLRDVSACADSNYSLPVRIVNEDPQSNFFADNLFINGTAYGSDLPEGWQLIHVPGFLANPGIHGTKNPNFTVISFGSKTILIGGTAYTGEIKSPYSASLILSCLSKRKCGECIAAQVRAKKALLCFLD